MKRLTFWIGMVIFLGWTLAMTLNYSIYAGSSEGALVSDFIDGILFMLLMLGLYFLLLAVYRAKQQTAVILLTAGGTAAIIAAVFLA
ncbi:hypothetical protein [Alkalicoccus urumqiensis]|uniref:Uncharacterized protein n=1 Tax=Alkalicoccus urumqiensis TaxID=1548213 RepID=A0A2P6MF25_ALKUR|nr:hypothetical protein [Alkalicoccus urumqiensis]PRO64873.1 hypothetical protein C6I21_12045 [Alkalicoccus urumqiensis]